MHLSLVSLLTFASAALLVLSLGTTLYDCLLRYRMSVRERLRQLVDDPAEGTSVALFRDFRRIDRTEEVRLGWWPWFAQELDLARVQMPPHTALLVWLGASAALTGAGSIWSLWAGLVLGTAGLVAGIMYVRYCQAKWRHAFMLQLPTAFAMISRAVRSGQTIPAALQIIADDFPPPIATEFARCHQQQSLGITREAALRQLAQRNGVMELQLFVVAILMQARSGGNLVELLDNLAATIGKRLKLRQRVRSLTGEGRMQALVLVLLPISALVGIVVLAPNYSAALLERPGLLAATAAAQAAGIFWIRKIVNFEY